MMKKALLILLTLSLVLVSCTNNVADPATLHGGSWEDMFREFWAVMDEDYVHFTYETVNWDNVYGEYLDKFKALSKDKVEDSFKAFSYFKEIVYSLTDYHYRLLVADDFGYILDTRPSLLQKWKNAGKDIMDFHDIIKGEDQYYSVNGGPNNPVTKAKKNEDWKIAINGYRETEDLGTAFHNSTVADYQFVAGTTNGTEFKADDEETEWEKLYREFILADTSGGEEGTDWDKLLKAFSLTNTSWYYGVTENGVLYIHFSAFVSSSLFDFYRYVMDDDTLTPEEKTNLASFFKEEKKYYDYLVAESEKTGTEAADYKKKLINFFVPLKMMNTLAEAVTTNSVTLEDGKTTKEIKGVVIDLRCNGGGDADFLARVMGTFFASDKAVGTVYSKMGYSRYDYTPASEFRLGYYNTELTEDYKGRVGVIVNGMSVSCSEIATITSKLLPSSRTFGSTTFGATCALSSRVLYQSGPYLTKNLFVRSTTYRYTAFDGKSYEVCGITPDEEIPISTTTDARFDKAVEWVATGK